MIDFLFSNILILPSINKKNVSRIEKLINGNQIIDLIFFRPYNIKARRLLLNHRQAFDKETIITKVEVDYYEKPGTKSAPFKVYCHNEFGDLVLVFFKIFPGYIKKNFAIGKKIALSGKIEFFNNQPQISHPDFVFPDNLINKIPQNEVIYPLTFGLTSKMLGKTIYEALKTLPNLEEWADKNLIQQQKWPSFYNAVKNIHYPKSLNDFEANNINIQRLAYDELLAASLANLIAKKNTNNKGIRNCAGKDLVQKVINNLPFALTQGQNEVLDTIFKDMQSDRKMLRLLQGDVGSGKTIIAFLAAILAYSDQKQSAIIVPISLLAQQHFETFQKLITKLDINVALLTSQNTKKEKAKILADLKSGTIDIIIGTHALIYDDVIFKNLSLIIIDEQHRFGVMQRLDLVKKGQAPEVLLMSATPIPRSLMMTLYGDMDISLLKEKPKNRITISTLLKSEEKITEVYQSLKRAISKGEKIYWICPLIEESQELDFANVSEKFELFQELFGHEKVALIHGKLKAKEKDKIMEEFAQSYSKIQILIATTVIEVGIDIKDASIIIIENSEKFGLSQLHQLRGRVGRGEKKSYCILLYSNKIGINGKKRLEIMRDCFDGFEVAEEDLKMRGSGQIFGTKQSGLPEYKFANLVSHQNLLQIANKDAQNILEKNPNLSGISGQNIKNLLRIFKYDNFLQLVKSG